jgi:hypothetical protein
LAEQKLDSAEIGRRAMFYWCEVNFNRKPTEIEIRQMIYVIESERKAAE